MSWLVDTDILSQRTKKQPNPKALKWLEENAAEIYTSSHVIGEIQVGIEMLTPGAKKRALQAWVNRLIEAMEGRILNFNTSVATVWGRQEAEFSEKGCLMPMPASFIASALASDSCPSCRSMNTGLSGVAASIQSWVGNSGGDQFCSSHSPPRIHSPFFSFFACAAIRPTNSSRVFASVSCT